MSESVFQSECAAAFRENRIFMLKREGSFTHIIIKEKRETSQESPFNIKYPNEYLVDNRSNIQQKDMYIREMGIELLYRLNTRMNPEKLVVRSCD